ncbi:MAG: hypothetical protein KJI72_00110 [Patescibacteria group bacterium]|nr:hypothetical protein [Patescibacteria group bacterium]
MAKVRAYIRVGKSKRIDYKVSASPKPNYAPLESLRGMRKEFQPTVAFAVDFDIPDELFEQAEKLIGEVKVSADQATIAADISKDTKIEPKT